ncbi:probable thiopurine S-methyltransferase [Pangasianodon hypophthalmus]|uniref:probable thiopurine S-methyltransferase n=1 Tax=Pangasianodon hypophthalmus TaxID=310915 RepID=UPI002307F2A4|nr:probable thiopurine S-methyltransferase [Pangasianodon hypophthalmus]XP_026785279.2 probable thiopurine S-methyltransferase [Pangasianodon hypophthalmus]
MMAAQIDRVMALSEWEDKWQEGRIGFHQPHIHQMLKDNLDKVLCGRQQVRVFFPLCGKAVDMKWLADMGHVIVGVEISEKAIKQFFEEHSLEYKEEPVPAIPEAKVFKSSDAKISLYQCDLYKFSSAIEGHFGGIWDRGSLVAINPCDRQKYATLIMSLMDKDCRYLLDTLEYNPEFYEGPPFFVPEEAVKSLYGDACDIELVQTRDAFGERYKAWGIDSLLEKVYLLSPKTNLN